MGLELLKAEAAKGARSTSPDANDLVMRGAALVYEQAHNPGKDKNNAARALYEQALAIDPNNAAAIAGVAVIVDDPGCGRAPIDRGDDALVVIEDCRVVVQTLEPFKGGRAPT